MRRRLTLAFAVAGLCLAIVGLAAHYNTPGSMYTLALATVSAYLGLGAVVAAVLFAVLRNRTGRLGLAATIVVVGWSVALHAPAYIAESAPTNGTDLVVMTSNLKIGAADASAVVSAVRSRHVDVVMFEELTPDSVRALRSVGLSETLPYSVADPRGYGAGTGIWSRYPLTGTSIRRDLGFSYLTAHLAARAITVAAVHVYGPYPSAQFGQWHQDMARYPALLGALTGRTVLVGGDFNATSDDAQFRDVLDHGFADAADQAGAGFTPTWPADRWFPPLVAIDHVLTRGGVARTADSVEIPGSDHRALVVGVRIPAPR